MSDEAKIRKEGMKLIEEFSRMLEKIPETEETHYVVDLKNITRKDGGITEGRNFSTNLKRITPRWEDGYVVAEKGV
jgi:aspartyl-tRNA(Asn)/glutamyl-tRNA(Gln) amidotransferase subunit C